MAHTHDQDPHARDPRTSADVGWPDLPAPADRTGSSTSWYAGGSDADRGAAPTDAPSSSQDASRPVAGGPYGTYGAAPADAYGRPAPDGGYGQAPVEPSGTGLSIASMVIGILSVIGGFTLLVPPIVGVVLGHMGLKREPRARGFAIAGLVTNYISLAFLVLAVLAIILLVGLAGAASFSAGS